LVVSLSAALALLLSIALLELGLTHMAWRYLLCLAFGYLSFLVLLRLVAPGLSDDLDPGLDFIPASSGGGGDAPEGFSGEGGDFGGGGASASWGPESGAGELPSSPDTDISISSVDSDISIPSEVGGVDLEERPIIIKKIAVLVGVLLAGGYIFTIAPLLVAEVVLDVAIAAGADRAASRLSPQHWVVGAIRHTWLLFVGLAVVVAAIGFALEFLAPGAHTIGAALARMS